MSGFCSRRICPVVGLVPDRAPRDAFEAGNGVGVASHQVEIVLVEPRTDRHLGRLCDCNAGPKGKPECTVPGCGVMPFDMRIRGFEPRKDFLAPASYATLCRRAEGRLASALDLPAVEEGSTA